jgi:hypothetical protein
MNAFGGLQGFIVVVMDRRAGSVQATVTTPVPVLSRYVDAQALLSLLAKQTATLTKSVECSI